MIKIRIVEAENLPTLNCHQRKTLISCFSFSSYRYYYGTYKNSQKTNNPKWNIEFNVDLFKLITLRFNIYGYRFMKKDFYIGSVTIDFRQFISNSPGDQILATPGNGIQNQFPIVSAHSSNSKLTLNFTYFPSVYRSIKYIPTFYMDYFLHIWATFSPILNRKDISVEIELLQAFIAPNENDIATYGYYYNLNKRNSWESVGRSSLDRFFLGPTGPTQIHTLSLPKLNKKYTFFILNVSDYSGKITLNFAFEKAGDMVHFVDKCFIETKKSNQMIELINTIDVDVQPNTKYLVPTYLFFQMNSILSTKYRFNDFLSESELITFDKTKNMDKADSDYISQLSSEIEFHSQIIDKAHTISGLENVHFLRTNILPLSEKVSISKILKDCNLKEGVDLRFYVGGSTTNTAGMAAYVDYWHQNFVAYDKNTGQICTQITKLFEDELNMQYENNKPISFIHDEINWNSVLTLNLNDADTDTVLVYYVYSNSYLMNAFPSGFFWISHFDGTCETLIFRNTIFADSWKSHYAICFRIEFIENEWQIIPSRQYYETKRDMEIALDLSHLGDSILNGKEKGKCESSDESESGAIDIRLEDIS